jgi:hypothetical protein
VLLEANSCPQQSAFTLNERERMSESFKLLVRAPQFLYNVDDCARCSTKAERDAVLSGKILCFAILFVVLSAHTHL